MWPEEGDFPENMHRVVCVIINKRSFESFMSAKILVYIYSLLDCDVPNC